MNDSYGMRSTRVIVMLTMVGVLPLAAVESSTPATVSLLTHVLFSIAVIVGVTLAFVCLWLWYRLRSVTSRWLALSAEVKRDTSSGQLVAKPRNREVTERTTEVLIRQGLHAARIGGWEHDLANDRVSWSEHVHELFGLTPEKLPTNYTGLLALIHADDRQKLRKITDLLVIDGRPQEVEIRVIWPNGSLHWQVSRVELFRDETNRPSRIAGMAMDITERKRIEDELRASEQRYRAVISAMHEGVVIHAADGTIVDNNRSAEHILGLSRGQLLGIENRDPNWRIVREDGSPFPPEEHPSQLAQQSGQPQHGTIIGVHRPDGALRWLSVNANPLLTSGSGSPIGAVATFSDITDRMSAERALRDSEKRWRSLAENIPDTIAMVDRTGTILFINHVLTGLTREDVLGAHINRFMPQAFTKLLGSAVGRIFDRGEEVYSDVQANEVGQAPRWYSCHISPVRHQGHTIAATVRTTDITERRTAEEERRRFQSERERLLERLQVQMERMPIGCLEWDRQRRITYANPAAEVIFEYESGAMVGLGLAAICRSDDQADIDAIFERLEHGDMGTASRHRNRTSDDQSIVCEWHPTPLFDAEGVFSGALTTVMDVGERESLEEQLRQSQKMEAVGRLAGGIAHDFNNLLTAIMGYSELLDAKIPATDVASGYVQQVKKSAKRAASLTYQLLAFSRKQVLQVQSLVLGDVINDLVPMLRRLIGEHIVLKTDFAPDTWQVLADASQWEQVVMNLVVNARDAMPKGGSLIISTRNRKMDASMVRAYAEVPPGDYVMMIVSDTGEGMEEDVRKRIFEPFFTTKSEGKGTGLGLAVVFGVVKQSGGFIFVDSVPGKGARFDVLLPRAARTAEPFRQRDSTAQLAIRGSETILLVEDDDGVRGLVKDTLEASGYTVLVVSNGKDALELSAQFADKIDLLLTDVVMPGLGGREVADRVKQQRPLIKVLFMSGYTDDIILSHGVLDGSSAFIEKPFSAPKLLGRIRKVLAGLV
jgi:two-component system, cell cycle sensor histidine kinase and response regulator CckA